MLHLFIFPSSYSFILYILFIGATWISFFLYSIRHTHSFIYILLHDSASTRSSWLVKFYYNILLTAILCEKVNWFSRLFTLIFFMTTHLSLAFVSKAVHIFLQQMVVTQPRMRIKSRFVLIWVRLTIWPLKYPTVAVLCVC